MSLKEVHIMSSHVKTWHHWTIVVWRWKDHQWFQQNGITPCTANITLEWLDYHFLQRLSVNAKIIRVPTFAWPESHRLLLTGMFEGSCIWEHKAKKVVHYNKWPNFRKIWNVRSNLGKLIGPTIWKVYVKKNLYFFGYICFLFHINVL